MLIDLRDCFFVLRSTLAIVLDGWSDGRSKQRATEDMTTTLCINEDFSSNEVQSTQK
jgi:hypothetical protein